MAFLVFEGLDGSGKSTLIKALAQNLDAAGISYELTREPGGTPLAEELREILIRSHNEAPTPKTELLLYEAGRAQHVDCKIRPALEQGRWVLCDRYTASSLAFQAGGRELNPEPIEWLNDYATGGLEPDLWVLLNITVEEGARRMKKREHQGQEKDRFELEEQSFHQRVRDYYLKLAEQNPQKWLVLNATASPKQLESELLSALKERGWLS